MRSARLRQMLEVGEILVPARGALVRLEIVQGNQAKWQAARYHDDYVKVNGEWKIRHLRVKGPGMSADYEKGWAAKR